MKKNYIIPLFIATLGISLSSYGMKPEKSASLTVLNSTPQKIEIKYTQQGEEKSFTLVSNQSKTIDDFNQVTAIYTFPYGKVRGWLTTANIPGELVKSNLLENETLKFAQLNNQDTQIIVKPGGTYLSYLFGKQFAQEISPYKYEVTIKKPQEAEKSEGKDVLEYFPQIQAAIDKGKPILPRYVLNIGENASPEMIDDAHEQMRLLWQEQKDSENPAQAALAVESLELINEAYKSLQGLPNNFDMLVAQYQPIKQAEQPAPFTQEQQAALRTTEEAFAAE